MDHQLMLSRKRPVMSPTAALQQVQSITRGILENVSADQMQASTPCASWDVKALINHMVGANIFFAAGMAGQPPAGIDEDFAEGDFLAAFDTHAGEALAAFQQEGALERTVSLPFGDMPGMGFMGIAMSDTFQHAWDLAKATGQDTNLAPELATQILAASKQSIQDSYRGPEGAPFGPPAQCADDACPADQLAAFLGREV